MKPVGVVLAVAHLYGQTPLPDTPRELLATDPRAFVEWLQTERPAPVTPRDKARILTALPSEGEVTHLDDAGRQKLAAMNLLLHATDRDSVYDIKVIDVAFARIGVFERTIILVSKSALTLLDAEDLQALVAHEIGHEYLTVERERAFRVRDHRRFKDLELLCDAIAIVTLYRLGLNPSRLMAGVEKITRYNQKLVATAIDDSNYPTVSERRSFAHEITAWIARTTGVPGFEMSELRFSVLRRPQEEQP